MAVARNRVIFVVAIVFLLSFLSHRNILQDSLRHLLGGCIAPVEQNNIGQEITGMTMPDDTPRKSNLQSQIDAVFIRIQNLIPHVPFTPFNESTSGRHSTAFIVNPREQYCVGDDFVVQLIMYNYLGNRKTYGGDFIRPRLFSKKLGASMSGRVEDFNNGSYHVHFTLYWAGKAKVSCLLWHPSEGIAALWRARHSSLGVLGFQGHYVSFGKQAVSTCGFQLDTKEEVCEYKDDFYEEAFYCIKPRNFSCDCLTNMRAVDIQASFLTPGEKQLFQWSNVGVEIAQNVQIMVTNCGKLSTPKPKCQTGMSSPIPSGYFLNDTWNPVYCNMMTYTTGEDFTKCLQGKRLFLIGDSTLRQFIMHFTEGIKIAKYFRYHESGWHSWEKTLEALNMDKDMYISYKRHGFPLESFMFYYFKEDLYTSRQIDRCGGGKDTIIVITMGQHFRQFPLKLYIKRALNIRRATERLFLRSPDTKVIIKTENTREINSPPERIGDFHGYSQYLVLREVFQGINVGFVDAWDMTVASATATVHPPGATFASIMSLTFTFAC